MNFKLYSCFVFIISIFACGQPSEIEDEWEVVNFRIRIDSLNDCNKSMSLRDSLGREFSTFLQENYVGAIYTFSAEGDFIKTDPNGNNLTGLYETSYQQLDVLNSDSRVDNLLQIAFPNNPEMDETWNYEIIGGGELILSSGEMFLLPNIIDQYVYPARECYSIELNLVPFKP